MTGILMALAMAAAAATPPVDQARALVGAGRTGEAIALLQEAAQATAADAAVHNMLGALLNREGRYREALPHALAAVRLAPDNPRYRYNRGIVLAEHGRFAEAIEDFDHAIAVDPTQAPMHLERGAALLSLGRADAARADWAAARRLDPRLVWTDWYEGLHDLIDGNTDAAILRLEAVSRAEPGFANGRAWLALAYRLAGRDVVEEKVEDRWVAALLSFQRDQLAFDRLLALASADRASGDQRRLGEAWLHRAVKQAAVGERAKARGSLRRALAVRAPRHAWKLLAERLLDHSPSQ